MTVVDIDKAHEALERGNTSESSEDGGGEYDEYVDTAASSKVNGPVARSDSVNANAHAHEPPQTSGTVNLELNSLSAEVLPNTSTGKQMGNESTTTKKGGSEWGDL